MQGCGSAWDTPREQQQDPEQLSWTQTSTQDCSYFFFFFPLGLLLFYFILFWKKSLASHISILWKGNPNQIWFFYRKRFQPTLYLWLCIPVLWLPISLSGEYSRESLFGLYNTHPHKQNNNNSLKGWIQWPVLPLPFPSFVPPLFLHIDFLFFSHRGDWD